MSSPHSIHRRSRRCSGIRSSSIPTSLPKAFEDRVPSRQVRRRRPPRGHLRARHGRRRRHRHRIRFRSYPGSAQHAGGAPPDCLGPGARRSGIDERSRRAPVRGLPREGTRDRRPGGACSNRVGGRARPRCGPGDASHRPRGSLPWRRKIARRAASDINGVPFFIFNGSTAVSGAHEPKTLLEAIAKARSPST